jgi:hypothetical protein
VKLEGPPAPAAATAKKGAFVLLAAAKERNFDTLAEAVLAASDGDTIEIRGNGPFVSKPVKIDGTRLTIRAAQGFRPVIKGRTNAPLVRTDAPLVLEGLELQVLGQEPPPDQLYGLVEWGSSLHVANCRFLADLTPGSFCLRAGARSFVRNCEFLCRTGFALGWPNDPAKGYVFDNCLAVAPYHVLSGRVDLPFHHGAPLQITRNTLVSPAPVLLWLYLAEPAKVPAKELVAMPIRVEAAGNVFDATSVLQLSESQAFLANHKPLKPPEAEALLRQLLAWRERSNCYAAGASSFTRYQDQEGGALPPQGPKSLADWERFWGSVDTDSQEGRIRFRGGNLLTKLRDTPEKLTPEDFRLRPDSAGYRAGKDGKDLGADIDLVGPGPAYERWKKTPQYQQWLKETGQIR